MLEEPSSVDSGEADDERPKNHTLGGNCNLTSIVEVAKKSGLIEAAKRAITKNRHDWETFMD